MRGKKIPLDFKIPVSYTQLDVYKRQITKKSREAEFTAKMHSVAYRVTKAECLDLPETTDIIRPVQLEPAAMKLYKNLVDESFAELSDGDDVYKRQASD